MENISFDTKVELFKEQLVKDLNESGLPLSVLEYILSETLEVIKIEKNKIIISDRQKMTKEIPSNE